MDNYTPVFINSQHNEELLRKNRARLYKIFSKATLGSPLAR